MIYQHKNFILDTNQSGKGKLYVDGSLRFMGDPYIAIQMLLRFSENHPDVRAMFKQQLEMREKPRFTQSEKKVKEEPPEQPKPKVKPQRRSRSGMSKWAMSK